MTRSWHNFWKDLAIAVTAFAIAFALLRLLVS
jgi:hypothetical protein